MPIEQSVPMTVQQGEQQVIYHSLQYLQKYIQETYGSVKTWSPEYVKSTLATIENLPAVNSITGKLASVSEPLINSLDQRIGGVLTNLDISNLSDLKSKAGKLTEDLTMAGKTYVTIRAESLKSQAEPLYNRALEIKTDIEGRVDGIKNEIGTKAVQWNSVRGDLSKKSIQRLEDGFSSVKLFSSEQSKAYLHIDLIQYATEVIDNAQTTVKPTFEILNQKIATGVLAVTTSISSFQEMALQKSKQSLEQAEAFRAELRVRLAKAIAASRELSHLGAEYVVVCYHRAIQSIDRSQLQSTVNDSVHYILEAPKLFTALAARLEQIGDFSGALESIHKLLASLQEVVIARRSTGPGDEKEEKKEMEAKKSQWAKASSCLEQRNLKLSEANYSRST